MWKTEEQIKDEMDTKEEHIVNFQDGSEKEVPVTLETIQEAKHIGVLRNLANDIKLAVNDVSRSIKNNDILEAGRGLERINTLANFIIEES